MKDNTLRELAQAQSADMLPPQVAVADTEPGVCTTLVELAQAQLNPDQKSTTDTFGASLVGTSEGDIARGFTALDETHEDPFLSKEPFFGRREDDDGSTYEGDPYSRGGFLDRPAGYER